VLDTTPNFIFAKDRDGRFTLANQALADVYGVRVEDLIGRTDAHFRRAEPDAGARETETDVLNSLQQRSIPEERIIDARGGVRWLQTVKRPIMESDGRADQVLSASTDITDRKRSEMELLQQRADLAHVARVSLMGELAASLAHELSQPLTAILANASAGLNALQQGQHDAAELSEILEDVIKDQTRAAEVLRQMRRMVKKESSLEFGTVDLGDVVREVVKLVRNDAALQHVEINLQIEPGLPPARGIRVQLQQVLLNLLLNALEAMKDFPHGARTVGLDVRYREGSIEAAVRDHGRGLGAEDIERVFEPFYTTKRDGLGMGLSICRSIIHAHGGRLWARNNAEGGATFYFTLPVRPV
jgi:two-component system sensor kinase FixL